MENIEENNDFVISIPILPDIKSVKMVAYKERNGVKKQKEKKKINPNLKNFTDTIISAFRELVIKYNAPEISLTSAEVFSYVIDRPYASSIGGEATIKPTLVYFNRVTKVLNNKFKKEAGRYSLKE